MGTGDKDPASGALLRGVLEGLGDLNQSAVGRVIHEQVAQLVGEHADIEKRLAQTYGLLVHLLLDAYARDPSAEHVTRVNARLLELRAQALGQGGGAPGAGARNVGEEAPYLAPAASPSPKPAPMPAPSAAVPARRRSVRASAETTREEPKTNAPAVERRVNSAYRMHLDRKRDEIEKLQEALASNVAETITQNREFGALLEIELRALQQAEGTQEIEQLRQILIGGIEELIYGQRQLDSKLNRTADYLDLVRSDSDRLRDELHKVRLLSLTDEFTSLPNRRAFMRRLQDEMGRAQRYGSQLALALVDLDAFKAINDEYGHAAGDAVLRCYATQVLPVLRHHDMAARYGGEEFAVLLPNTGREGAIAALSKVRQRAEEIRCEHESRSLPIPTFSAGVALYAPGESHATLIDRADRALYRAKHLGRNRTECESADGESVVPTEAGGHDST